MRSETSRLGGERIAQSGYLRQFTLMKRGVLEMTSCRGAEQGRLRFSA